MKKNALFLFICGLLSVGLLSTGCASNFESDDYIVIGALLPLTGEAASEGLRALAGLQLAKNEINASGGILGKQLDIIALDDQCDPDYVKHQYHELMNRNVVAIIGSSYSFVTDALAAESQLESVKIPIISPTASHPGVTQGRPNVFRAIYIDQYQASAMAKFAYETLRARTAILLYNQDDDGFTQLSDTFGVFFEDLGGTILDSRGYTSEEDFHSIFQNYSGVGDAPDVFYIPEISERAAEAINEAYGMGNRNTYILGSDSWDGVLAYIRYNNATRNAYYTSPFSFDDTDPMVTEFVRNYFSFFSEMPLAGSATAYTSLYILADAIQRTGSTYPNSLVHSLKETDLNLITGHFAFDENNNPHTNVYIIQIKDGIYATREKLGL